MRTPRERNGAHYRTTHEAFWTKRQWIEDSKMSSRVRNLSAFALHDVDRWRHDFIHSRIDPLTPPEQPTLRTIYEVGQQEPAGPQLERLGSIAVNLAAISEGEPSYRRADQLLEVAMHLLAQKAILEA